MLLLYFYFLKAVIILNSESDIKYSVELKFIYEFSLNGTVSATCELCELQVTAGVNSFLRRQHQ